MNEGGWWGNSGMVRSAPSKVCRSLLAAWDGALRGGGPRNLNGAEAAGTC